MYDTVECPYCGHENDISDALCDGLNDDNKLDWECSNCEEEFEVYVEFEPIYYANKIEYKECYCCGKTVRDTSNSNSRSPFPKKYIGKDLCETCYRKEIFKEWEVNKS